MERYYTKSSGTSTKRSRSESSSIDLFQDKQNECAIAIPSSQNKPTIEGPLDLYVPNPGKRLPIMRIAKSAQEREMIRRIYLTNGPCQPKLDNFPQSLIGGKMRRFSPQWYNEFGPWLEYSESKDAVFCLHCYLFHCEHGDGRGAHDSFVVEGFRNRKDKQWIFRHIGKVGSTHNLCVSSAKNLMNQNQHIDKFFPPNPESPQSTRRVAKAGWFLGLGDNKKLSLPDIVKAGDPVLHKPAQEVNPDDISSERIQKIIDDMIKAMRKAPGVGLAAPQIGIPSRIIVLEDREEYISYAPKEEIKAQDRRPFDLLVILNPKLEKRSDRTALFFEGCLSLDGFRAAVERYLDVEVTGLDRNGEVIKINASGWQARILQHECDHLDGTLYVDKMIPRTFRTVENLDLPLAQGCPKLGSR